MWVGGEWLPSVNGRYRRDRAAGTRSRAPGGAASDQERKRKRVTVHISQCIHPRAQNLKGLSREGVSSTTRKALTACSEAAGRRGLAAGEWRAWRVTRDAAVRASARAGAASALLASDAARPPARTQNHRSNAVVARRQSRRATRQLALRPQRKWHKNVSPNNKIKQMVDSNTNRNTNANVYNKHTSIRRWRFKFLRKDYLWSVFCSLTLGTGRSFCVLRLTCSRERSGQIQWIPPLPQTWAPPRGTPCSSRGSSLRPKRREWVASRGRWRHEAGVRSATAAGHGRRRRDLVKDTTRIRHDRHERQTQCNNTELPAVTWSSTPSRRNPRTRTGRRIVTIAPCSLCSSYSPRVHLQARGPAR